MISVRRLVADLILRALLALNNAPKQLKGNKTMPKVSKERFQNIVRTLEDSTNRRSVLNGKTVTDQEFADAIKDHDETLAMRFLAYCDAMRDMRKHIQKKQGTEAN